MRSRPTGVPGEALSIDAVATRQVFLVAERP
jgi:hypothetical protein